MSGALIRRLALVLLAALALTSMLLPLSGSSSHPGDPAPHQPVASVRHR